MDLYSPRIPKASRERRPGLQYVTLRLVLHPPASACCFIILLFSESLNLSLSESTSLEMHLVSEGIMKSSCQEAESREEDLEVQVSCYKYIELHLTLLLFMVMRQESACFCTFPDADKDFSILWSAKSVTTILFIYLCYYLFSSSLWICELMAFLKIPFPV